uniref:Uncharacterized protein n=1 Tax=Physcomitrium patens TaxID=3218 RepID=A0A2K1IBK7_PHYPA|nr:hypothetical protein PHYPA_030143 [Physcomitrium patens]
MVQNTDMCASSMFFVLCSCGTEVKLLIFEMNGGRRQRSRQSAVHLLVLKCCGYFIFYLFLVFYSVGNCVSVWCWRSLLPFGGQSGGVTSSLCARRGAKVTISHRIHKC